MPSQAGVYNNVNFTHNTLIKQTCWLLPILTTHKTSFPREREIFKAWFGCILWMTYPGTDHKWTEESELQGAKMNFGAIWIKIPHQIFWEHILWISFIPFSTCLKIFTNHCLLICHPITKLGTILSTQNLCAWSVVMCEWWRNLVQYISTSLLTFYKD